MKTPEETLLQWVEDRVHFFGGFNPKGKEFWTRAELERLSAGLHEDADPAVGATVFTEDVNTVFEAMPVEDLWAIRHRRLDGPEITAQYIASFESMAELLRHFREKGWLDEEPEPPVTGI
jgi:hypothetical protein